MVTDVQRLGVMLAEGPLGGRPVFSIELPRSEEMVFTVPMRVADLKTEWKAARALVDITGRWPVAASSWGRIRDSVSAETFWLDPRGEKPPPPEIRSAAAGLGSAQAIYEMRDAARDDSGDLVGMVDHHLQATRNRCGSVPDRDLLSAELLEIRAQQGHPEDDDGGSALLALERWLFDWEERRIPTLAPERADHDDWFTPDQDQCHLLFLPTSNGAEALAYLEFFAEDGVVGATTERLIAILSSWNTRFGAELVAHWGTMLQFIVERPPESLATAWELATEQHLIAPCTNVLPGQTVRDFARVLWKRPTWFLHERP